MGHPADLVKVRQQCSPLSTSTATTAASPVRNSNPIVGVSSPRSRFATATTTTTAATTRQRSAARLSAASTATAAAVAAPKHHLHHHQNLSTIGMLRSIMAKEGVAGLYAGVSAPLLAVVPAYGVSFCTFDIVKSAFINTSIGNNNHQQQISIAQTAIAGGISGIPMALIQGPLEKIKCEFQLNSTRYSSLGDCLKQSSRRGLSHVFRGTGLTMVRDVPGNATFFATYEFVRRTLRQVEGRGERSSPSTGATLVAGGLAGMANWIVAIPMDTIKSRYQCNGMSSPVEVLSQLLRWEGPKALFSGLQPALLRAVPSNAAALLGVETVRRLLQLEDQ